jgi:hypothetical protein
MVGHSVNPIYRFREFNQRIGRGDQIRETQSGEKASHPFRYGRTNWQRAMMDEMSLDDSYPTDSEAALFFQVRNARVDSIPGAVGNRFDHI